MQRAPQAVEAHFGPMKQNLAADLRVCLTVSQIVCIRCHSMDVIAALRSMAPQVPSPREVETNCWQPTFRMLHGVKCIRYMAGTSCESFCGTLVLTVVL